ncbi:MAG: amino acid permease [Pseudomonadota bacterium]
MSANKPSNSRGFGLWTLVALVVGNAIGAGIYTTSGFSLASLGSAEWVLLAWFVAGLIALCGALSYGMLAQNLQESGGEYLYLSRSIHPLAGIIAGWISLLAGFPGAIAFAATALETYARSAYADLAALPIDSIAVTVTIAGGAIHIFRTEAGARTHEVIVGLMLLALVLVILWSMHAYATNPELPYHSSSNLQAFNIFAFANSLVWISLSYSGFNAAAYVAGEVANTRRDVPRGMVIGTLLTMLLCISLNAIMLYSDDPANLSAQPEIAALAAQALAGEPGRRLVEMIIAVSLLTSITAMAMAGPRVYAKMAEDGALPAFFRARAGQPPRTSIMLQVGISLLLILAADLRELLSYLGLTLSLCLALAVSSLFVRHWRLGERPTSLWYPLAPLVFVSCTVLFAVLSALNEARQFYAFIPTVAAGVIAYLLSLRFSRKPASG